jgi:hypothetical protein
MITDHIDLWLFAFGGVTSLLALQLLFPKWYTSRFNKIDAAGPALLYARQAGLAIAVQGALMIWAGLDPHLRVPTAVLVGVGKAIFVVTAVLHRKTYPGLRVSALVDTIAVVVLAAFLGGW